MYLRARPAWSCITHLPEIVVLVAVEDVVFRKETLPDCCSFVVALQAFLLTAFEDSGVEVLRVELENIDKVFPCPRDGFLLEIVAKRPVTEHLEHGVMIGVVTYFLKVVVLARNTKALLRIGSTAELLLNVAENDILELVHASVGEH